MALRSIKLHATLHRVQRIANGLGKQEGEGGGAEADEEFIQEEVVITLIESGVRGTQEVVEAFKRGHHQNCIRNLSYQG